MHSSGLELTYLSQYLPLAAVRMRTQIAYVEEAELLRNYMIHLTLFS